eukprot:2591995-Rhodomonas_salina.1
MSEHRTSQHTAHTPRHGMWHASTERRSACQACHRASHSAGRNSRAENVVRSAEIASGDTCPFFCMWRYAVPAHQKPYAPGSAQEQDLLCQHRRLHRHKAQHAEKQRSATHGYHCQQVDADHAALVSRQV